MKTLKQYREGLAQDAVPVGLEVEQGRQGHPTARVGGVYLHSRYNPVEEARRLVDDAALDPERPVLVVGLGLGYHVEELLARGYALVVCEPDPHVAALAAQRLPLDLDFPLVVGPDALEASDKEFTDWLLQSPRVWMHPPTARLYPAYADAAAHLPEAASLKSLHLNIAIVGAMYGGSVPISAYLADAFGSLGHHVLHVENDVTWPVYDAVTNSLKGKKPVRQLTEMLTRFMAEWTYARVAEFNPEICIVLAQAPVLADFPERLRKHGIVSAYWYVENWRHMPYWQEIAPLYDSFFHIQPGEFETRLTEAGCRHHAFVQTGCDPRVHRPVSLTTAEEREYGCDLSFAGAGYHNRIAFFRGLTDYTFKIWGVNWQDRSLAPLVVGGEKRFDNEQFMRIVAASKINLNLHSSAAHEGVDPKCDAINPRVFEIAAAGAFQICDPCIGLDRHFDFQTELPVYRDIKEARALIDHYLAHPEARRAAAERAQQRALGEHTYAHRARQMLNHILTRHGGHIQKHGVRTQRTVQEAVETLEAADPLADWLRTLPRDMLFTPENIEKQLQPAMLKKMSYPEKLFAYMREVRNFADGMMKEHNP